jgi:hypothetical protein
MQRTAAAAGRSGMSDRVLATEATDAMPVSSQQAEELNRLGQLRETYTPDPSSSRLLWIAFLVFFLLFGLLVAAIPFLPPPRGVPPVSIPLVLSLVSVCALIVGASVWRLRRLACESKARILVFAEGLARFDGRSLLAFRWEDIERVQGFLYKAPRPFACRVIITDKAGKQIRMYWGKERLVDANLLVQRVSEETSRYLFPRFMAAMEAGETVSFDPQMVGVAALQMSKRGIHWGKHEVAWGDTEVLDCKDGLRLRTPTGLVRPWVRLEDIPIPNYLVFTRLAEHYMRENRRDSASP